MLRRAEALRRALTDGPRPAGELGGLLSPHVGLWVELVRLPPSGTWERRRADLYGLAEQWVGQCGASEAEGIDHLVRSYLRGFGPAALDDVSSWSGVPARLLAPTLEQLRLRRFRDEQGRELLDLPRATLPPADTPAPVRFLPWWDAVLLVHARRTGVMPEEYRPVVFDNKNPPSVPTFLVDGRVAGAWRYEDGRVELEPYERLSGRVLEDLRDRGRAARSVPRLTALTRSPEPDAPAGELGGDQREARRPLEHRRALATGRFPITDCLGAPPVDFVQVT